MTTLALIMLLTFGLNTAFWSAIGAGRTLAAWWDRRRGREPDRSLDVLTPADVAVLIAAHDEELVIAEAIATATALVPPSQVFVVSDGSTDRTAEIARGAGVQVLELHPNRGKAGALVAGIDYFGLCERFEVVMFLDADTRLTADYLTTGLAQLSEAGVVAVAGRASTVDSPRPPTALGRMLVTYRERVYLATQYLTKYGQAARWANAVSIVPGFASMYRTAALAQIDLNPGGLVIEDFNSTFEVHAKHLGRIAFHPGAAIAYTQDPDTFGDYVKQVRRWALGFWQTVRRHRLHAGRFWVALAAYIAELVIASLLLLFFVPVLIVSIAAQVLDRLDVATWDPILAWPPTTLLLAVLLPDLLFTVLAVVISGRLRFLAYALVFPIMRIVDAALCLRALPLAWSSRDDGVWRSPARRPTTERPENGTAETEFGVLATVSEIGASGTAAEDRSPRHRRPA